MGKELVDLIKLIIAEEIMVMKEELGSRESIREN